MSRSSTARVLGSTQKPRATPSATFERHAIVLDIADVLNRTACVRALLREHLPHGAKKFIAESLGLRVESVTRQLDPQNTERLSEDVAIWSQLYLESVEGKEAVAHEIRGLRYAGLSTVTLQLPPGADTWTFTVNRKTGEIR